jgi:type I restriction enzyme R subunit
MENGKNLYLLLKKLLMKLYNCLIKSFQSRHKIIDKSLKKDLEALKNKADDMETLDKAIENLSSKIILEDPKRIEEIVKVIAKHFRENVEPDGYKAFVVTVSRKACVSYKKALDKYLPPEYSKVVISRSSNDDKELKERHLDPEQERQVRENFKDPNKLPKILIITDKLLTGFDAPILYCLYLDKIMRDLLCPIIENHRIVYFFLHTFYYFSLINYTLR